MEVKLFELAFQPLAVKMNAAAGRRVAVNGSRTLRGDRMQTNISRMACALAMVAAAGLYAGTTRGSAQQPSRITELRQQSIGASMSNLTELRAWDSFVDGGVRDGRLVRRSGYPDSGRPGRRVESFVQQYGGLEVYGGDVARILDNNVTIAMSGKVYEDIQVDVVPRVSAAAAAVAIERAAGSAIFESDPPQLIILPYLGRDYRLVYRATARDLFTYFLDAHSGEVVHREDLRIDQGAAVGRGTGFLGDSKKVSASAGVGTFLARDVLRPAQISTFNVASASAASRLTGGGPSNDSDVATSTNNVWTTGQVVDTHVHTGYTYDYFFKRHNYRGLDDQNGAIYSGVMPVSLLANNAFFISPPGGPNGSGGMFYGVTSNGAPMTTLDIVAHEIMHGVTFFNLRRRTGGGLGSNFVGELGPTGCALPFWCQGNRFLLFSNQSGAINEGLSDIFGTAVEFMFHPPGDGPLRAEYISGEDLREERFLRPQHDPRSYPISLGPAYPDHRLTQFQFPMIFVANGPLLCTSSTIGTQRCDLHPTFYAGNQIVLQRPYTNGQGLGLTDTGAVHWNLTILGHAYYLAIEGGQNRTSGLTVQGVGQANRDQIERVFFAAVRDFLPRFATFADAASALRQAAVVVHGAGSAAARAVDQALTAVGL